MKIIGYILVAILLILGLKVIFAHSFLLAIVGIVAGIGYLIWLGKISGFF